HRVSCACVALFFQHRCVAAAAVAPSTTIFRSRLRRPSRDSLVVKAAGAGFAGSLTRVSLADRDLFFQDRYVVAADGAPTSIIVLGRLRQPRRHALVVPPTAACLARSLTRASLA